MASDLRVNLPLDPFVLSPVSTTRVFAPRDLGVGGGLPRVLMDDHAGISRICVRLRRVPAHEEHAGDPCRCACGSEGERTCAQGCTEKYFTEGHRIPTPFGVHRRMTTTNTRRSFKREPLPFSKGTNGGSKGASTRRKEHIANGEQIVYITPSLAVRCRSSESGSIRSGSNDHRITSRRRFLNG